jgi:hypothetical protein
MMTVQKAVLQKAVVLLNSLGAEYVIQLQDEEPIIKGDLLVKTKKRAKKSKRVYPHGTFTNLFRQMKVDSMSVGDVTIVPIGDFPVAKVQSTLSSFCTNTWGAGSAMTSVNKAEKTVEVIRIN